MSAVRWSVCPACFRSEVKEYEEARRTVLASYGQIPVEKFDSQRAALGEPPSLDEWRQAEGLRELREDYQIGTHEHEDGSWEFYVQYSGSCQMCDFAHEFQKTEAVQLP